MTTSIPESTLEKFSTFGDLLRFLRRRVGITQMEFALAVGYSDAQISRLEQNLRLPDIPTVETLFVPTLRLQNEPKTVARLLDLAANVRREDAPVSGLCPYKGLSYFDEADADFFVGREVLTAKLVERVLGLTLNATPGQERFLAIIGASGSGKSSLVRAGLVPSLRWNRKSANWHIHILTPTAHPLESLATSLTQESVSIIATTTLMDDLARDPRSLLIFAKRKQPLDNNKRLLLVVDQFEELFALCHSTEERTAFIDNLMTAVSEPDGHISMITTLRADFYANCANHDQLRAALARSQEYIGAMGPDELRRVIEEPASRGHWELETGLVDLLLHDVGQEPGALPLLSHALLETWQRRRGRTLKMSGYTASGGVQGAIAETAETVFTDQLTHEQQVIARRIFIRLTELSDEPLATGTRRRASFSELILRPQEASATHIVLKKLADVRLIITGKDSVEVAHEALIREWPTLRGWLEENRDGIRLHRKLTEAAQEWLAMERDPEMLYRGVRLAQVNEWFGLHGDELNVWEREFLGISNEASEQEATERDLQRLRELEVAYKLAEVEKQRAEEQNRTAGRLRKNTRYLTGALIIALLLAVTSLFFWFQARNSTISAQNQKRVAFSRELAAASVSNLDVDPERSILLALEALSSSYTLEAEAALHQAIQASRVQHTFQAFEPGEEIKVSYSPDGNSLATASPNEVVKVWDIATGKVRFNVAGHYAAYSADGKRLATVTSDGNVIIWDALTGKELPQTSQVFSDSSVAFSPDASRLVTTSGRSVKEWDASTGRELVTFSGHTDLVWSAAFNLDGTRLITASDDGTARIWDAITGKELLILADHPGWVWIAEFSPDGKRIATASGNMAYIWDADTGEKMFTITGHTNSIYDVTFSPDGTRLATGSLDRKVKVWDITASPGKASPVNPGADAGKELFSLAGHTGGVYDIAFSPDGTFLASGSNDGTVRVWNLHPSRELLTFPDLQVSDGVIAFSSDGMRLAAGDVTGAVVVWDAISGKKLNTFLDPNHLVTALAFSPYGERLVTATDDYRIQLRDVTTGSELFSFPGHTGLVNAITFNTDGARFATASNDYKVKIWGLSPTVYSGISDAGLLLSLEHPAEVRSVAFSPDGNFLATGLADSTAIIWEVSTGKEILTLRGHNAPISAIAFNLDGKKTITASLDGLAKVWDVATGEELLTLGGHSDSVMAAAFSSDGTRLATASRDGSARLWDAGSGKELLVFWGDGSELNSLAFSPDGTRLATGGESGARVYLLRIEDLMVLAQGRVTRSFTTEECVKFLHLDGTACSPTQTIPMATPPPPAETGRICQLSYRGGLTDNSFDEQTYKGVTDAAQLHGWEPLALESGNFEKTMQRLLKFDCDLIVGAGFEIVDVVKSTAKSHPELKFQIMDFVFDPPTDNIWMQTFAIDQPAFLAGYIAASVSRTGKVGTFGGIDSAPVTDFMDGFALGVAYYNHKNGANIEVLGWDVDKHAGLFVGDFCCAADGRQITERLLDEGADIILPVAGSIVGSGAADAVLARKNAYVIGVDTDWAIKEPQYASIVLTSIEKRFDVSVVHVVEAVADGVFTGGVHVGTLAGGEVGLSPFYNLSSLISSQIKADLEQIRVEIISGKIRTRPQQ